MTTIKTVTTKYENGSIKTVELTDRLESNGKLYITTRFYSESGVYLNFFQRPAA